MISSSSSLSSLNQPFRLHSANVTRTKREDSGTDTPPEADHANTPTGDRGVLAQYVKGLRAVAGGSTDGVSLDNIPSDSTFGRWWQQLYNALKSPRFEAVAQLLNIDTSSPIKIDPINDTLTAMVKGKPTTFSASQLGREWAEVTGPIMAAARALSPASSFEAPTHPASAPLQLVARFYGEVLLADREEATLTRATQLEQNQAFDQMSIDKPFVNLKARAPEKADQEALELGDNNVKYVLVDKLAQYKSAEHGSVEEYLRDTKMALDPNSAHARDTGRDEASLEEVLAKYNWHTPQTQEELGSLISALAEPALRRSEDGNLAGALTWPTPLSLESRSQIVQTLTDNDPRLPILDPDAPLGTTDVLGALVKNVPAYLLNENDPMAVLEWILNSDEGQQLGTELLKRAGDNAGGADFRTWLLTVLGVSLDMKSLSQPQENHVAGFNLSGHEGKTPAEIRQALIDHLKDTNVTTPQAAPIAALLLLSRAAPELLVKGVPAHITKGSFEWLALKAAVAGIEALSPGASAHMSYAEVVAFDDITPATDDEIEFKREAQLPAIIEWGKNHGTLDQTGPYSAASIERTRQTIEEQQQALVRGYEAIKAPFPTQRDVALALLKATFGEGIDFEAKVIKSKVVRTQGYKFTRTDPRGPSGSYSLLDLYLAKKAGDPEGWFSNDPKIDEQMIERLKWLPDPVEKHQQAFEAYESQLSQGWATLTKNLIANLPMEDRKNIEHGKLTIYETGETTRSEIDTRSGATTADHGFSQPGTDRSLIVKTERDGQTTYYQFDPQNYVIRKRPDLNDTFKEGFQGPWVERPSNSILAKNFAVPTIRQIETSDEHAETASTDVPASFTSARSEYLGKLLSAKILPLYRLHDQKDASVAVTTFDNEARWRKIFQEIFLGIIPGASPIRHIINGDYLSAASDVIFDVTMSATVSGLRGAGALKAAKGTRLPHLKSFKHALLRGFRGEGAGVTRGAASSFFHRLKSGLFPETATAKISPKVRMTPQQAQVVANRKDLFEGTSTSAEGVTKRTIAKYDEVSKRWREYDPLTNTTTTTLYKFDAIATTHLDTRWMDTIRKAEHGPHAVAFRTGYLEGAAETVPGYKPGMSSTQIKKLTVSGNLSPRDIGILVRQQERVAVNHSLEGVSIFSKEVRAAGGTITPMPQLFYLSQTQPLSKGECAALSHLMVEARKHGKGQMLIDNFYTAAANPNSAASKKFINTLTEMQAKLETPTAFHGGSADVMSLSDITDRLLNATESKTLMMGDAGHAMTAGVRIEDGVKKFYLFEPNYGLATFDTAESFRKGMNNVFTSKEFSRPYTSVGQNSHHLELNVSENLPDGLEKVGITPGSLDHMYSAPI